MRLVFIMFYLPLPWYFVVVSLGLGLVFMIPAGGASIRPGVTLTVLVRSLPSLSVSVSPPVLSLALGS